MIKNESLSDRLNEHQSKKDQPNQSKIKYPSGSDLIYTALGTFFTGLLVILKAIVYGFSLKLIFHTDWTILSVVCIGLAINFVMTYIYDLIHDSHNNLNL